MEPLKHECGIAMIRLRKPLSYYQQKYGTWMYGLNKLYLLMEKQHNRGQEGAGLACVKLNSEPGSEFMFRERAEGSTAISAIFNAVHKQVAEALDAGISADQVAREIPFAGELYMGHLRYSTTGKSGLSYVHPFMRRDNYRSKNLTVCGNFILTDVEEVYKHIVETGQHPRHYADTFLILEQLGHRLDREVERIYQKGISEGVAEGKPMTEYIERSICIENVLSEAAPLWDGGFVICGLTGSGESFALRDPWGIRPAFYYVDDEVLVTASERPVIQTAFNVSATDVHELEPGCAVLMNQNGDFKVKRILDAKPLSACSFERIYFSRGSDEDIYLERKKLGEALVPDILKALDGDTQNSVFSYIPNTAEVAFYGMVHGLNRYLNTLKNERIRQNINNLSPEYLDNLLSMSIRTEKVAIKDIKLRTFISEGNSRNELATHVYDITYGSIRPDTDNLVVIDDSIVRGTTLRQSIIRILARLKPKKLVIVSSAPQIRYPDFYGIDMSRIEDFIAFKAAIALLEEQGRWSVMDEVYALCKKQALSGEAPTENYVKKIYAGFTDEQLSAKMAELLTPTDVKCKVEILFQRIDGLHKACPNSPGDWYFSGDYPTPGGIKLVNSAYIRYYESERM